MSKQENMGYESLTKLNLFGCKMLCNGLGWTDNRRWWKDLELKVEGEDSNSSQRLNH